MTAASYYKMLGWEDKLPNLVFKLEFGVYRRLDQVNWVCQEEPEIGSYWIKLSVTSLS